MSILKKKMMIIFICFALYISLGGVTYADITQNLKLILWAIKGELEAPQWNYSIRASIGTDTSAEIECSTGGQKQCKPFLKLIF